MQNIFRQVIIVAGAIAVIGATAAAQPRGQSYNRLAGTYQIDRGRSDDARRVAARAVRGLSPVDRQRVEENLAMRLDPPEFIAIDRNGRTVSIASSMAPMGTFDVDGRARSESMPSGRVATVRASFYGDQLTVSTTGNRGSDFTVTFEPIEGGNTLLVTRTLDAQSLPTPVKAQSFYRRTASRPDWHVYNAPAPAPLPRSRPGIEAVPSGTVLVGRLNTPLGSRTSRRGDRFSLTVSGPAPFQGATIDGIVTRVGGPGGPGRNELLFDFDRIRLRDGRTAEFAGVLSRVRTPDGRVILVDTEGVVESGSSRTDQAVQGGAIGAAVGALIGAFAGGGKGAVIGAAVGAGAGAGSVYAVGRDLDLPRGSEIRVISQPIWDRR